MSDKQSSELFVALDVPTAELAWPLVEKLKALPLGFKVGMELFYREGMPFVTELQRQALGPVFVDLKLHDIPNTVYKASKNLASQGVRFFNIHTLGGTDMMEAAVRGAKEGAAEFGTPWDEMAVIGVTVLTSCSTEQLVSDLKVSTSLSEYVVHLANCAKKAGLHGVVCSAQEATVLREVLGADFYKITPGIRLADASVIDDQVRVMTPDKAVAVGATHLVVGRPITQADDPAQAASIVLDLMNKGLVNKGLAV
jgi:orotidine-5'-phosphate decarboxylase